MNRHVCCASAGLCGWCAPSTCAFCCCSKEHCCCKTGHASNSTPRFRLVLRPHVTVWGCALAHSSGAPNAGVRPEPVPPPPHCVQQLLWHQQVCHSCTFSWQLVPGGNPTVYVVYDHAAVRHAWPPGMYAEEPCLYGTGSSVSAVLRGGPWLWHNPSLGDHQG